MSTSTPRDGDTAVDHARRCLRALYAAVPSDVAADVSHHVEEALAQVWDDAAEATTDWVANNPGPSGIPSDPPRNPYARPS